MASIQDKDSSCNSDVKITAFGKKKKKDYFGNNICESADREVRIEKCSCIMKCQPQL